MNPATQQLVITGRAKDTIVLLNGENVPPGPIEDALQESPLFDQCMLLGQDQVRTTMAFHLSNSLSSSSFVPS